MSMIKDNVLLKVRNVKKYFNTPSGVIKAIDDVSFDVKEGEIVGLIGESGSGKTTVGRCLIRLYEQYSGFVGINGQAISGNKLNKKQKMFLNQNMQMIFQDPHASLNGQQNIYTILKEPLIVNKIMKNEYEDFFRDWKDIKNNFKFTFSERLKEIELDTIVHHVQQAELFLHEWLDTFRRIKFKYLDIENDFNQYFAYKHSIQERDSNIISKMFQNNSKILNMYFEHQKEFRNNSILLIEQELKKKKIIYETILKQSKKTPHQIEIEKKLEIKKEKLKRFLESRKNTISNSSNILISYAKEFKNSYISHLENARSKTNFQEYNEQIKYSITAKKMHSILNSNKKNILYLSSDEIDNLINDFKQYKDQYIDYISETFKATSQKKYATELKKHVNKTFDFDFGSFYSKSENTEKSLEQEIAKIKEEINVIQEEYTNIKNETSLISAEEIEKIKNEYLELEKEYENERETYSINFNKRMKDLEEKIISNNIKLEKIREQVKKLNIEFDNKHNEFLKGLEEYLLRKGENKHHIKDELNVYINKVKTKDETLEAFNVEILNLNRDLDKLKHLLGIENSFNSKRYIKKILMNEKIYKSLEDVGLLRQFAWRYPHEFSGGQRQRIVIARALISNPKIIIADEPIASLDVSIQAQVVNILKELCEKKNVSLIFIAHDLSMVEYIADKILIMHLGKIVEFGKTSEIYSNPIHPYTINLFKSMPKISNANDKFESSNFELGYLDEQKENGTHVDFIELNKDHIIYSTVEQFGKWTSKKPKVSEFSKNPRTLQNLIENYEHKIN
ncbi:MAG: ATP-binding cassette domain-containing protein [Mycoplasma sp.]|nr:ATP-binding cassette domain-containing protein [Mycoplasma sp.]